VPDVAVPAHLDEINADWFTRVLQTNYPNITVLSATPGTVIHGSNTKIRYLLEYDQAGHAAGLPATLWFKGSYEPHSGGMAASSEGEVRFYQDVSPVLPASVGRPACYYAAFDPQSHRSVLLIEDLLARNAVFGRPTAPLGISAMQGLLDVLAALHASHWGGVPLHGFRRVGDPSWGYCNGWLAQQRWFKLLEPGVWTRYVDTERGLYLEDSLRDPHRVAEAALAYFAHLQHGPIAILHGDAGVHNSYTLPGGAGGFVDWSSKLCGHWSWDVGFVIVGGLEIEDRRTHARQLLEHYRSRLLEYEVRDLPTTAQMWTAFRRTPIYGLMMWLNTPVSSQPDAYAIATSQRFAAASADLETLSALAQ
jgi:hypothetical protein